MRGIREPYYHGTCTYRGAQLFSAMHFCLVPRVWRAPLPLWLHARAALRCRQERARRTRAGTDEGATGRVLREASSRSPAQTLDHTVSPAAELQNNRRSIMPSSPQKGPYQPAWLGKPRKQTNFAALGQMLVQSGAITPSPSKKNRPRFGSSTVARSPSRASMTLAWERVRVRKGRPLFRASAVAANSAG